MLCDLEKEGIDLVDKDLFIVDQGAESVLDYCAKGVDGAIHYLREVTVAFYVDQGCCVEPIKLQLTDSDGEFIVIG